jgi:hypothetical protein
MLFDGLAAGMSAELVVLQLLLLFTLVFLGKCCFKVHTIAVHTSLL